MVRSAAAWRYLLRVHYSALSNPKIAPFLLGFRCPVGGGPIHGHRQHAQNVGKDRAYGSGDILSDRQTDATDQSQYFGTAPAGEVTKVGESSGKQRMTRHVYNTAVVVHLQRRRSTSVLR